MTQSQMEVLATLFIGMLILLYIKDSREKKALDAIMNASDAFTVWRKNNPYVYLGLSDVGKKLLTELIMSHDTFCKLFPFVDGQEHREYLMSLYDDLPPKPYKPNPAASLKPSFMRVFIISTKQ